MIFNLSFEINCRYVDESEFTEEHQRRKESGGFVRIDVSPTFNGNRIGVAGLVFDAIEVIARQDQVSGFDPFTCSCGVSECAGIFDHVEMTLENDALCWTFPEDPFRSALPSALFPPERPMVAKFIKRQYLEALSQLEQDLIGIESLYGKQVAVVPDDFFWPTRGLVSIISDEKDRISKWLAMTRARKSFYGDLLKNEVRADFEDGTSYLFYPESIIYFLFENEDQFGESVVGQKGGLLKSCLDSPAMLFAELKRLPWLDISDSAVLLNQEAMSPIDLARGPEASQAMWLRSKLSHPSD